MHFKGGCIDFSHLTKLKNIYITEIYKRKQNKSSDIKNKKKLQKKKKKNWGFNIFIFIPIFRLLMTSNMP